MQVIPETCHARTKLDIMNMTNVISETRRTHQIRYLYFVMNLEIY